MRKSSEAAHQNRIFPLDAQLSQGAFDKAVISSGLDPFRFHNSGTALPQDWPVGRQWSHTDGFWRKETPPDFLQLWGNVPRLVGSLYAPNKPIGLILADKGSSVQPLTDKDFAVLSLVPSQTNANLARLAQPH